VRLLCRWLSLGSCLFLCSQLGNTRSPLGSPCVLHLVALRAVTSHIVSCLSFRHAPILRAFQLATGAPLEDAQAGFVGRTADGPVAEFLEQARWAATCLPDIYASTATSSSRGCHRLLPPALPVFCGRTLAAPAASVVLWDTSCRRTDESRENPGLTYSDVSTATRPQRPDLPLNVHHSSRPRETIAGVWVAGGPPTRAQWRCGRTRRRRGCS
jgi:hypothetical protein